MDKEIKEKLEYFMTIVGWILIAFALYALIRFAINAGVFK